MELVENNHGDALQIKAGQDAPRHNPLRHNFDAGLLRDPTVKPDRITERLADLLAQSLCHPPGGGDGGDSPGFKQDNPAFLRRENIKERQGNPCRFAGAGRGLKNNGGMLTDGRRQLGEDIINGVRV